MHSGQVRDCKVGYLVDDPQGENTVVWLDRLYTEEGARLQVERANGQEALADQRHKGGLLVPSSKWRYRRTGGNG